MTQQKELRLGDFIGLTRDDFNVSGNATIKNIPCYFNGILNTISLWCGSDGVYFQKTLPASTYQIAINVVFKKVNGKWDYTN